MTVNTYITKSLGYYPDLNPTCAQSICHALCVVGNGLEWNDRSVVVEGTRLDEERYWRGWHRERSPNTVPIDKIRGRPDWREAGIQHIYPMSESYSLMATFPDTIAPDWLEIIVWAAQQIILMDGKTYQESHPAQAEENVRIAHRALERALALKEGQT